MPNVSIQNCYFCEQPTVEVIGKGEVVRENYFANKDEKKAIGDDDTVFRCKGCNGVFLVSPSGTSQPIRTGSKSRIVSGTSIGIVHR